MASSEQLDPGGTAESSMMWPHSLPRRVLEDAKSGVLELDVQADEEDNMSNFGTLAALPAASLIASCQLTVSSRVSCLVASEALRSLFMFENLRSLQLRFDCCSTPITDRMVAAIAELMLLTRLTLLRGSLLPEADLGHWSSLRRLQELVLLPSETGGLRDAQLEQLTLLTPCLTSLTVRPHPDHITSAGRWHVASLTNLQQLSVSPLAAAAAPAAAAAGEGEMPDVSGTTAAAAAAAAAAAGAAGSGGLTGPRDARGLLQCTSGRISDSSGGGCSRQLDGHELSVLDLQRLVELPGLTRLQLGLTHPQQVLLFSDVKLPKRPLDLLLTLHECHPSSGSSSLSRPCSPSATSPAAAVSTAADVLSVLSWSLTQQLVSLSLGPLAVASPNDVLLMVATLRRLQMLELNLLAAPDQHSSGTLDLLVLRPLSNLRRLALRTSARLYVPMTIKTVSLCALAWPELQSLSLSLAGKPELMPESLALCDNFRRLQQLELLSPLEDLEGCSSSLHGTPTAAAAGQQQGLWRGGSSSWTQWAVAGLEGLGLVSSSSAPASALNAAAAEARGQGPGSSPLLIATRLAPSAAATAAAGSPAAVSSPLARDVRQQQLVHQHHHSSSSSSSRLPGQLRVVPGSSSARNAAAIAAASSSGRGSSDYSRLLASANGGHLSRTVSDGLAAGGAAATGRLGRQQSLDVHQQHQRIHHQHQQQQQQQGGWSPKLLQGWLPTFGAADGTAAGSAQLDCVRGGLVAGNSSSGSMAAGGGRAWTRMLAACQGGSSALGSPSAGLLSSSSITVCSPFGAAPSSPAHQQQLRRYSSSGWPATGSGSLANTPRAAAAAAAPPGAVMAMHRAAARMVPVNLLYLPQGLQELSLESCHLLLSSTAAASNSGGGKPDRDSNSAAVSEEAAAQAADSSGSGIAGQREQQQVPAAVADAPAAASEQPPAAAELPDSPRASSNAVSLNAEPLSSNSNISSSGGSMIAAASGHPNPGSSSVDTNRAVLDAAPRVLPGLQRLRLSGCLLEDATLAALITSCSALKSLQLSGVEGLTDAGLSGLPSLHHLTCLHIEAERGVSLAALSSISRLVALKQLHFSSKDSLHGPADPDRLAAQLCALTGLHQLLLETAPGSSLDMAGWKVVLQRRLPLCRLLTSPLELLLEEGDEQTFAGASGVWGDSQA